MGEEALDFLNIAFRKVNLEGFEIMATCRKIRKGKYDKESGQEAADLLICAFEEDQVDYDNLDHKAKNAVYEVLFFVISHPRCFSGNQRSSVKELVEDGIVTLTKKQSRCFDAWCERICDSFNDGSFWSEDEDEEDYHGGGYKFADYTDYYFYDSD